MRETQTALVIRLPHRPLTDPYADTPGEAMIVGDAPPGLSVWEGVVKRDYDPAGSTYWQEGTYRALTDEEWQQLREGKAPWDDAPVKE